MDNRSMAALIETKRTKMNSVIICLPSKGAGREKRTRTKYTTEKVDGSGEGGGSQKKLPTPSSREEWQAQACEFMCLVKNVRGGLNIMATDT